MFAFYSCNNNNNNIFSPKSNSYKQNNHKLMPTKGRVINYRRTRRNVVVRSGLPACGSGSIKVTPAGERFIFIPLSNHQHIQRIRRGIVVA